MTLPHHHAALVPPLDHTNPRHLEEIRQRYLAWLADGGPELFDRRRILSPETWRLVARQEMHTRPLRDQADWIAADEYRTVAQARLFHCDAATTQRLLGSYAERTAGAFTPQLLPVPVGMVMFGQPVAYTPMHPLYDYAPPMGAIAVYWRHVPDQGVLRLTTCLDIRSWRIHAARLMARQGYHPDDIVESLTLDTTPELSMAQELEVAVTDDATPRPWAHSILAPAEAAPPRAAWLPVLHGLWEMMTDPHRTPAPSQEVPPAKPSIRRMAAQGIAQGGAQWPTVSLVYWRKPRPAPEEPPTAAPQPTGHTWTLDHEVPVRGYVRKIRDADGNVVKEVPVEGHTRGKGLGPKKGRITIVTTREDGTP